MHKQNITALQENVSLINFIVLAIRTEGSFQKNVRDISCSQLSKTHKIDHKENHVPCSFLWRQQKFSGKQKDKIRFEMDREVCRVDTLRFSVVSECSS